MRYAMKQKFFCLGDDFRILDEDGRDVYLVDGKAFALLAKRLVFLDMAGTELAEIRQRLLSGGRRTTSCATGKWSRPLASICSRSSRASSRSTSPGPTISKQPGASSTMSTSSAAMAA